MDCPGIMPGPEYERTALLRHCGRLFVTGANMTTPMFGVVVRKAYGMGVRAMCGGSSLEPFCTVAWPTAEFADMTIDGRVKLLFGEELDAIEDPDERQAIYERLDRCPRGSNTGRQFGRHQLRRRRCHRPGGYTRLDRPGTPKRPEAIARRVRRNGPTSIPGSSTVRDVENNK